MGPNGRKLVERGSTQTPTFFSVVGSLVFPHTKEHGSGCSGVLISALGVSDLLRADVDRVASGQAFAASSKPQSLHGNAWASDDVHAHCHWTRLVFLFVFFVLKGRIWGSPNFAGLRLRFCNIALTLPGEEVDPFAILHLQRIHDDSCMDVFLPTKPGMSWCPQR